MPVSGTVYDQNGNAVGSAQVIAVDQDTGDTYTTTTDSDGTYSLSPGTGTYEVYTTAYQTVSKPYIEVS